MTRLLLCSTDCCSAWLLGAEDLATDALHPGLMDSVTALCFMFVHRGCFCDCRPPFTACKGGNAVRGTPFGRLHLNRPRPPSPPKHCTPACARSPRHASRARYSSEPYFVACAMHQFAQAASSAEIGSNQIRSVRQISRAQPDLGPELLLQRRILLLCPFQLRRIPNRLDPGAARAGPGARAAL